jgi:hypothetical protein
LQKKREKKICEVYVCVTNYLWDARALTSQKKRVNIIQYVVYTHVQIDRLAFSSNMRNHIYSSCLPACFASTCAYTSEWMRIERMNNNLKPSNFKIYIFLSSSIYFLKCSVHYLLCHIKKIHIFFNTRDWVMKKNQ